MRDHARLRPPQLAGDEHGRRLRVGALELRVEVGIALVALELDAVEAGEEVDVPPVAAELAVGDRRQAQVLLQLHDLADQAVFRLPELRGLRFPDAHLLTQLVQLVRAQKAADMVGPERRGHA